MRLDLSTTVPGELIAAQRSPKHVAEIKYTICFVTHETHKIVVCEIVTKPLPPASLPPRLPPPPLTIDSWYCVFNTQLRQ